MWLIFSVLVIIIFTYSVILERMKNRKKFKLPPGPIPLPIIGNLLSIDAKNPHLSLTKLSKNYNGICGLWMGSVYTVLLSDPKLVRQALARDAFSGRAPLYLTHGIMKGYGLICAEGKHWKEQRKFVSTTLKNFGMVKQGNKRHLLEKKINYSIMELFSIWRRISKETKLGIDPLESLHHCIGNLMNNLVFGKTFEENDETWRWLRHLQEDGVKHIGIAGAINFLPILRYLPKYKKIMSFLINGKLKTHEIYKQLIDNYKEEDEKDNFLSAFAEEMKRRGLNDDEKLGSFTEQQFYHLLADIFGAGTDTTLTTVRWFLLYMAVHPEEQRKIYVELSESLGERDVVLEDRERLPYLEASICEVQRIRSVVPVGIPHGTVDDTSIGEFDIPRGSMIVPLQWAIHMDEKYWTDPEEFRPSRFISEGGDVIRPEAFIPFQNGKRMCVGDELARMILFLYAGRIIQKFTFSMPSEQTVDLEGECGITLIPKQHRLIFLPR